MSDGLIHIYKHDYPVAPDAQLLRLLKRYLPHSIVLLRRITLRSKTSSAPTLLATFPQDQVPVEPKNGAFIVALADRSLRPNPEVYTFSSLQIPQQNHGPGEATENGKKSSQENEKIAVQQLLTLLLHVDRLPIPTAQQGCGVPAHVIFLAATHEAVAASLRSCPNLVLDKVYGRGGPFTKLAWRMSQQLAVAGGRDDIPAGLAWDTIRDDADKELVKGMNPLIRLKSELDEIPSLGLREISQQNRDHRGARRGSLISWALLSPDGSVRSLYTQPEYRGHGLAKRIAAAIVKKEWPKMHANALGLDEDDDWIHGDAAPDNAPSVKTFLALGAKPVSDCFWIRVDMHVAKEKVGYNSCQESTGNK